MALTTEEFNQGMTAQEYLDQIKVNKEAILAVFNSGGVSAEDKEFFDGLHEPLRLAVFTADWCGDAVTSTPPLLRLADATEGLVLSVFNRDEVIELTNSFLPVHRHGTLPVFVAFDSRMQEVSRFIETAKELVPALDRMQEKIAKAKEAALTRGDSLADEGGASQTTIRGRRMAYRVAHACEWGQVVTHAFTAVVKTGLALPPERRPAEGGTEWPPSQQ
jgi:hypothetical protein